ncbi:MAG: glutamate 5-kinase [Proteobacteria bacterium]|nr:glutamate 5-kinase [Pseudomonadota bacterium]
MNNTPAAIDESEHRALPARAQRWVVKIGSSLISRPGAGLDYSLIESWSEQIVALRAEGVELAVVSSGAVAAGMERMGIGSRPKDADSLRALAAVGQPSLVHAYESVFTRHDVHTALLLLTHEDFNQRARYLNMRATVDGLLSMGVVPVFNENDTVTTDEIRLGDNDILAALAADLASAQVLVILTDCAGLYDKNPVRHRDACLISMAEANDSSLDGGAELGGDLGTGGMISKLKAARLAARSGCTTFIADGREADVLTRLRAGDKLGTMLLPPGTRQSARKRWIHGQQHARGKLFIDAGAVKALTTGGKSLLCVGVTDVDGEFNAGDIVACIGPGGDTVAHGISNLSSRDARQLKGLDSTEVNQSPASAASDAEIIHRNNLALSRH